jgi:predicted GNAT family acetyltransferase
MTPARVEHDEQAGRFVARTGSGDAYLAYERTAANTLDLQHTVVPEEERGRGVGESLVRAAFDHARQHHQRVIPSCPFVASWLEEHPEAQSLVAVGG